MHQFGYVATAANVRRQICAASGQQPGDPVHAVEAPIKAVASGHQPHHLLLGNNAFDGAMAKLRKFCMAVTTGEVVARAADFIRPKQVVAIGVTA
jgi:hypothetical protein